VNSDGTCSQCPRYEKALIDDQSQLQLYCGSPICELNQRLLPDGNCENCPPYTKAQDELNAEGKLGTLCGPDQCDSRQILL
jgi:hypothetical protein